VSLALVLTVACGGGAGEGTSSACEAAEDRLEKAQDALALAQESRNPAELRRAIDERASAAEEFDRAC
jgi:hypothetical protein